MLIISHTSALFLGECENHGPHFLTNGLLLLLLRLFSRVRLCVTP